jgi:hypothetical protein
VFWVISVYFNIRNTLPKSGTFLLGHLYILQCYERYGADLVLHQFEVCEMYCKLEVVFEGFVKYVNYIFKIFELVSITNFNAQFLYSITICMLRYNPRHVSSINMPIFRRTNGIITASVIVTPCKRLYSMLDESGLQLSTEIVLLL